MLDLVILNYGILPSIDALLPSYLVFPSSLYSSQLEIGQLVSSVDVTPLLLDNTKDILPVGVF